VGTPKRERQKANRQLRLEQMAKQSQRKKTRKRVWLFGLGIPLAVAALWALALVVGGDDDDDGSVTEASSTTVAGASTTVGSTTPGVTTTVPVTVAPGAPITGETPCPPITGSDERVIEFENPPPMCIDAAKTYTATIVTNFGTLEAELFADTAPETVNNFVVLSGYQYFDQTECHRIIPGFMVQCGDPTATGTGGPGYEIVDELPAEGEYVIGSLAMANTGQPDSGGSQFFIVTGEQGMSLPPSYALFGQVTVGLDDVLPLLDAAGNPANNGVPPLQQVVIESITITES
jgi:cyclophilin family peptidyl-prolyl cis-trans isomerase